MTLPECPGLFYFDTNQFNFFWYLSFSAMQCNTLSKKHLKLPMSRMAIVKDY